MRNDFFELLRFRQGNKEPAGSRRYDKKTHIHNANSVVRLLYTAGQSIV
ncbi:MAG TPA: hypothetical protein VEI73_09835 [Candidatus Acidoferrum sp.]|nr:hypothetical protein [Candidatus Acidoferrum sp.]